VDFYEDFSWAWEKDGFGDKFEVRDSVEARLPLAALNGF
jgi:hypothetical protein